MRSMSRGTFDSVIDDFIEDDFEKSSAFSGDHLKHILPAIWPSLGNQPEIPNRLPKQEDCL